MQYLKKLFPKFLLPILSTVRQLIYNFIDSFKPYLNKIKYCGFDVYYVVGEGLIYRIRWGNTDRIYERQMCEKIKALLQKSDEPGFLDIGSNIGLVSFYLLSKVKNLKIYAFEPGPHQYKLFSISLFANKLDNSIELFNVALADKTGTMDFKIHVEEKDSSGDGFIDTQRAGPTKSITVKTLTLDDWWKSSNKPKIDVVKIDTEGAELMVLKGGKEFFSMSRPIIFLEIALSNLKNYPYNHSDVLGWLEDNNYELFTIDEEKCDGNNILKFLEKENSFTAKPIYR